MKGARVISYSRHYLGLLVSSSKAGQLREFMIVSLLKFRTKARQSIMLHDVQGLSPYGSANISDGPIVQAKVGLAVSASCVMSTFEVHRSEITELSLNTFTVTSDAA